MTEPILIETHDRITTITINRPHVRNALNAGTICELTDAFLSAGKDSNCRAIILTATGTDAFCAGADLQELQSASDLKSREHFFSNLSNLIQTMHQTPKTIIAAIHGFALAGGCGLVAAADIALASEKSQFGLPELYIGLAPMVVMPVLHRAIGRRALADLVLSADRISAEQALAIGLVSRIYPENQLTNAANELAKKITHLAPHATARAKQLIYQIAENNYLDLLNTLPLEIAKISLEGEAVEGVAAFMEKRPPPWQS